MKRWFDRRATPRAILIASWVVFALYAYPGYMTTASIDELVDSRIGQLTDWHSPMMTEVWRVVGHLVSGPAGMLALQSVLTLAGVYTLLRRVTTERAAAILAGAILVFPPILAMSAVLVPESQLAAFLVAGAAAVASPRHAVRGLGIIALVIAAGMAAGGTVAVLPLIALGCAQLRRPRWQRYVIAVAVWVVIASAAALIDRFLVDSETRRNQVQLAIDDTVGVLRYAGPIDDAQLRETLGAAPVVLAEGLQARAKDIYGHADRYQYGDRRLFDPPASALARDALENARWSLLRTYPGAYLHHRWHQFVRVLGLSRGKDWTPVYTSFAELDGEQLSVRHDARHAPVQKLLIHGERWLGGTFLFHPYWYFLLALVLLPVAAMRRQRDVLAVLGSGILYELVQMFVTDAPACASSHWMILTTIVATTFLIARRYGLAGSDATVAGG